MAPATAPTAEVALVALGCTRNSVVPLMALGCARRAQVPLLAPWSPERVDVPIGALETMKPGGPTRRTCECAGETLEDMCYVWHIMGCDQ